MSKIPFAILLFAVLVLANVSVSYLKVTAQSNGTNTEKPTGAACSPEEFKKEPGLCAVIHALKHTSPKGSATSAEKPATTTTEKSLPECSAVKAEVVRIPLTKLGMNGPTTWKLERPPCTEKPAAEKPAAEKPAAEKIECPAGAKVKRVKGVVKCLTPRQAPTEAPNEGPPCPINGCEVHTKPATATLTPEQRDILHREEQHAVQKCLEERRGLPVPNGETLKGFLEKCNHVYNGFD
jgi:hypothetical protein